jgi:4-hydroxymandelate oxidase
MNTRRAFLSLLAASPLFASRGFLSRSFAQMPASAGDGLIVRASEALDVFDFEPVAHRNIPPAHWGYLVSGVDG